MSTMDKPRGDTIRYMRPPLLLTCPRQRCAVRCRVLCGARRCAMRCGVVWWELSSRFADVRGVVCNMLLWAAGLTRHNPHYARQLSIR